MDIMLIIRIALYVLIGGVALYFKYNEKLNKRVAGFIDEAEEIYKDVVKAGGKKHAYVVDALYSLIPAPLRLIFTKEMISGIVDRAFAEIENYAKKQLDKVLNK